MFLVQYIDVHRRHKGQVRPMAEISLLSHSIPLSAEESMILRALWSLNLCDNKDIELDSLKKIAKMPNQLLQAAMSGLAKKMIVSLCGRGDLQMPSVQVLSWHGRNDQSKLRSARIFLPVLSLHQVRNI